MSIYQMCTLRKLEALHRAGLLTAEQIPWMQQLQAMEEEEMRAAWGRIFTAPEPTPLGLPEIPLGVDPLSGSAP